MYHIPGYSLLCLHELTPEAHPCDPPRDRWVNATHLLLRQDPACGTRQGCFEALYTRPGRQQVVEAQRGRINVNPCMRSLAGVRAPVATTQDWRDPPPGRLRVAHAHVYAAARIHLGYLLRSHRDCGDCPRPCEGQDQHPPPFLFPNNSEQPRHHGTVTVITR